MESTITMATVITQTKPKVEKDADGILSNTAFIPADAGCPPGRPPNPPSVHLWSLPSLCHPPTPMWSQTSFLVWRVGKAMAYTCPPFPARGSSIPQGSLSATSVATEHRHTLTVTSSSQSHRLPTPPSQAPTWLPPRGHQDRGARLSAFKSRFQPQSSSAARPQPHNPWTPQSPLL